MSIVQGSVPGSVRPSPTLRSSLRAASGSVPVEFVEECGYGSLGYAVRALLD